MSIAKILGGIQRDVEESECRITSGVVESVSPLRIKKDKLSITKDYLIVSPIVQLVGLKKGQKVVLLQANKQQTYYILEILNESVEQVISKLIKTNDATLEASLKAYVNNKVKTDVPTNAKFTDTITTINGKTGAIAKADITALGIPAQDTQTTINGKTGAITKSDITALGIPAQDTVTSINGKTGAITKADITALGIPTQDTVTTVNGKTGTVTPQDLANAVSGNLYASSNAEVFGLYGSTYAYMGFYANGTNRSAFLGNASPDNKNLYINNETSGADILLSTVGSGKIIANGKEVYHTGNLPSFAPTSHNHSGANITSGTVPVARLGMTVSKATNGYIKLPDGVFLQWGRVDFTGTASSYKEFTFPIAFPSACRSVVGSFALTSGTWYQWTTVFGSVSRTGARVYVRDGDNSGTGLPEVTKGYVYWLAMGY